MLYFIHRAIILFVMFFNNFSHIYGHAIVERLEAHEISSTICGPFDFQGRGWDFLKKNLQINMSTDILHHLFYLQDRFVEDFFVLFLIAIYSKHQ